MDEKKILELARRKNEMFFVPSAFKWMSLEEQKHRAKELSLKTKK